MNIGFILRHKTRLSIRSLNVLFGLSPASRRKDLPTLLVCSPGGVATTEIMDHLREFIEINSSADKDRLKHPRKPPRFAKKIIYIYGDPDDTVRSLARRRSIENQSSKLGSVLGVFLPGHLKEWPFKRAVKNQIRRFTAASKKYPEKILAVSYQHVFEEKKAIAAFAEITDPAFLAGFPTRKDRTTV